MLIVAVIRPGALGGLVDDDTHHRTAFKMLLAFFDTGKRCAADASDEDEALLGKLLITVRNLAKTLGLANGYRVVVNTVRRSLG